MINLQKTLFVVALGAALGVLTAPSVAEEVPPGTVINAANLDAMKDNTFEGKRIGDMIPERNEWQIREHGLTIKLKKSEPHPVDPRWAAATKKYAKDVKFDTATREVSGYKAGMPFPEIDPADPHAGIKVIWNFNYGVPHGDIQDFRKFAYLLIDGDSGLERTQQWAYIRYYMKSRLGGEPVKGDGSIYFKQLLFATYPQDIKGLGTFMFRYDTGKRDDVWAYIRTVRRIRRLSGGAWMDPIGGTDQLQDDIEIFNAHPTWYPKYNFLGKKWTLVIANSVQPTWIEEAGSTEEKFPRVDLTNPPYWNPLDEWEPRECDVVEAITPEEHPYSRKVMYFDAMNARPYFSFAYDRKGEFWKSFTFASFKMDSEDGETAIASAWGSSIDFQRRHATIFQSHKTWLINPLDVGEDDVTLGELEAAGR